MARLPLPTRLVRENLAIYFNSSVLRHSIIRTRREAFLVGPTRAAGYSTKRLLLPPAHSSCTTRCPTFGPNCLFIPLFSGPIVLLVVAPMRVSCLISRVPSG